MTASDDARFMELALEQARAASAEGEAPVGAVTVKEGTILALARNEREALRDPTAHAEMIALRATAAVLGGWRLEGVTLYATLEPCPMCAGALVMARVSRLVYGARDPKAGAVDSVVDLVRDPRFNHRLEVTGGVLAEECGRLLSEFFTALRGELRKGG